MKLTIVTLSSFAIAAIVAAAFVYFYGPKIASIEKPGRYFYDLGVVSEHGNLVFFVAEDMDLRFFIPAERKSIAFSHSTMEMQTGVSYQATPSGEMHDFTWINKTKTLLRHSKSNSYETIEIDQVENPWTILWPYMDP